MRQTRPFILHLIHVPVHLHIDCLRVFGPLLPRHDQGVRTKLWSDRLVVLTKDVSAWQDSVCKIWNAASSAYCLFEMLLRVPAGARVLAHGAQNRRCHPVGARQQGQCNHDIYIYAVVGAMSANPFAAAGGGVQLRRVLRPVYRGTGQGRRVGEPTRDAAKDNFAHAQSSLWSAPSCFSIFVQLLALQGAHVPQFEPSRDAGTAFALPLLKIQQLTYRYVLVYVFRIMRGEQEWHRQLNCVTHLRTAEARSANKVLKEGSLLCVVAHQLVLRICTRVFLTLTGDLEKRGKKSKLWMRRRVYVTGAEVPRPRTPC